ncbi:hypothetical protein ACFV4M_17920 [Kitasatospora indigofera]|uniref:hypothetical protein n=1 Tax=Kitasatospora indigofera TaxID=67307 RepID=UPI0036684B11
MVVDDHGDTPALHQGERALLRQLRQVTDHVVLAVLPSYRPGGADPARRPSDGPGTAAPSVPVPPPAA